MHSSHRFGVTATETGLRFAAFVEDADTVRLCFFREDGKLIEKYPLVFADNCWSVELSPTERDLLYCYEVCRKNTTLFLSDPFARSMNRLHLWREKKIWPVPVAEIFFPPFDWGDDKAPQVPLPQMLVYEAHVKGLTILHPDLPTALRGTYGAVGHDKLVAHLKSLGVTTIELLPVHAKSEDPFLAAKKLTNYWGYNTLGFFAPESSYAQHDAVVEFKSMVRELHRAGIEVILDVVYNHTGEGGKDAPAISFRGMAERAYYRMDESGNYIDYTSCGNTLNTDHPHTRDLVLQSLRYWAEEMHVDGFRFDLAPALFRKNGHVDFMHELFLAITNDPVLRERKLIAEPWDTGPNGYQRGNFPEPWLEWNDRFRDTARRFWKGEHCAQELAHEMLRRGRPVINYVTCHDGFTLADVVSYERKHNEANLEENRDGADHNHSFNCGAEGPTNDARILALRKKQVRNLLMTLFFAQDIPMLLAGDEIGNSQNGNNNAYCQDNAISWLDWKNPDRELLAFVRELSRWRKVLLATNMPQYMEAPTHFAEAFGIRFGTHLLLMNAARDNIFFPLHGVAVREILHTARFAQEEPTSDIYYLSAQSAVLLEVV